MNRLIDVLPAMLHLGLIVGLIMLQPDAGTALSIYFYFNFMLFAAGISYKIIAGALVPFNKPSGNVEASKPYQQDRILVFLNPELDPMGKGYHVIQSQTAIGSGQFLGKGLLKVPRTILASYRRGTRILFFLLSGKSWDW